LIELYCPVCFHRAEIFLWHCNTTTQIQKILFKHCKKERIFKY